MSSNAAVSVLAADRYDPDVLDRTIAQHMEHLQVADRLFPGIKVLLKPNLLSRNAPEKAVTTQPEWVAAVARWLRRHGVEQITLADSPGGPYTKGMLEGIYRTAKMTAAEGEGVTLNTATGYQTVGVPEALLCREFPVIDPVMEADLIINLPRLKTHGMMMLSLSVKNLFGYVPGLQKPEFHFRFPAKADFARMLVDLSLVKTPVLTLADAIISMEGDGPASGTPRHTGQTFASWNPYALDWAMARFVGMEELVLTVTDSRERNLFRPEEVVFLGDGAPQPVRDFCPPASRPLEFWARLPRLLQPPAQAVSERFLTPVPVIRKSACIGCGKCAESCAPDAATIQNGKAVIRYSRCIKCFCCHEMCPVKAIGIRRAGILRH